MEKLKERCRRLENTLFGSNANGTVELKDQLKRKYTEVEELYSQQATDRKKINGLELLCKEGERMIHNLCQSVDTLMAESRRTRREFKVSEMCGINYRPGSQYYDAGAYVASVASVKRGSQ